MHMHRVRGGVAAAFALLGMLAAAVPATATLTRTAGPAVRGHAVPGRSDVHTQRAERFVAYGHHGDARAWILDTKTSRATAITLPPGCTVPWGDISAPDDVVLFPCRTGGVGDGVLIDGATGTMTRLAPPAGVSFSDGWRTLGRFWMQLDDAWCPSPADPAGQGVVRCTVFADRATGRIERWIPGTPRAPLDAGNLDDPDRRARKPASLVGRWVAWLGRGSCPVDLWSYDRRTHVRTRVPGARIGARRCPEWMVQTRYGVVLGYRDGQFPTEMDDFTKAYRLRFVPRP